MNMIAVRQCNLHTANETINMLRDFSGDHLISKNIWPPSSPDLTPQDFFSPVVSLEGRSL
jgi:hypothetical protein